MANAGRRRLLAWLPAIATVGALGPRRALAAGFDQNHAAWTVLLKKYVVLVRGGEATKVRYGGFKKDGPALTAYLASLSSVSHATFSAFDKPQQMAFLINAYNAFTVELILTGYPGIESIKDLGSLFASPWKKRFVPLLGDTVSLDDIEQGMLRARGRYDDPRIHFALNCASIGCPALREEAYIGVRLDEQLTDQARRFMSDRSRNRWNTQRARLEVSQIFHWYEDDFQQGWQGIKSSAAFFALYADQLADAPADRQRIVDQKESVSYLDYDWKLNAAT